MGVETQPAIPVWLSRWAIVAGGTQVEQTIGAAEYFVDVNDFGEQADWLLVQATGADIYLRIDGHPATATSFTIVAGDPPVFIPWIYGTSVYSFVGSAAGSVLILAPITVH